MAKVKTKLPSYACHKNVGAFKIVSIGATSEGTVLRSSVVDGKFHELVVSTHYIQKHRPKVGGYYVRYEDGYESFSPAGVFENGYTLGEAVPITANVLEIAKFGYDLWRKANPSAKILKAKPPTAYKLFNEKKYERHADKWIDAAQKL